MLTSINSPLIGDPNKGNVLDLYVLIRDGNGEQALSLSNVTVQPMVIEDTALVSLITSSTDDLEQDIENDAPEKALCKYYVVLRGQSIIT